MEQTARIEVNAANKEIKTDVDEIDMNVGETRNLVVSPDFSPEIITETNFDILSLNYTKKLNGGTSYNLEITARNGGNTTITITDKHNKSVCKTVKVNVSDPEGTVAQVSCSKEYSAIIKSDGALYMTGKNNYGQFGIATLTKTETFVKTMDDVKQVSCGDYHTGIIKQDGSLWMCGYTYNGQLGNGRSGAYNTKNPIPEKLMDDVAQISCGGNYTSILKKDGSLWMCGDNMKGQLGNGTTTDKSTPVKIMDNVAQVSCGSYHTGIIKKDGSLWMCGKNTYGQLGNGTNTSKLSPVKIMDGVAQVSCGSSHTGIIKTDGSLWMCGENYYGQFGNGEKNHSYDGVKTPEKIMDDVAQVNCSDDFSGILKNGGILYMCGYNREGALGDSRYRRPETTQITIPQ